MEQKIKVDVIMIIFVTNCYENSGGVGVWVKMGEFGSKVIAEWLQLYITRHYIIYFVIDCCKFDHFSSL